MSEEQYIELLKQVELNGRLLIFVIGLIVGILIGKIISDFIT